MLIDESKNKPTNPELWSRAKALAKQKFDVYPSAYANGWAAKWYKSKGGKWESVKTESYVSEVPKDVLNYNRLTKYSCKNCPHEWETLNSLEGATECWNCGGQGTALGLVHEDLRKWFGRGKKGGHGGGGWDRYDSKGNRIGKCAREPGEPKPKCLSREKAAKMTKKEIAAAVSRKREADPVADRRGKGGKPVMSSNKIDDSYSHIANSLISASLLGRLEESLCEVLLFEGRVDRLKKQHDKGIDSSHDSLARHREPHDIIDHFATNADPSKNKKHTQQILSWYKDKQFRQEDAGRVRQVLKDFESHGKKLPKVPHPRKPGVELPGHDISSYGSFHGLNKALEPFRTSQSNTFDWGEFSKSDLEHVNGKGSTVIHDDPKYTVREVHDQRAMDVLGRGADWCVVSNKHRKTKVYGSGGDSSLFDDYKKRHPGSSYYHVHDKETGERFAAHPASDQFLFDEDDVEQGENTEVISKYKEGLSKTLKNLTSKEKLSSPYLTPSVLHDLRSDSDKEIRRYVADSGDTHSDTLHAMHTDEDRTIRSAVASNPNTRHDTLHALHTDGSVWVKAGVAKHPNSHPDSLHALHTDKHLSVRTAVARNSNTRHDTLHAMHTYDDVHVRSHVANNPNTRHDTLHALSTDEDAAVQINVAKNSNTRPDTLHALSSGGGDGVRWAVAKNSNTRPDTLHTLRTDYVDDVRVDVASNPNTRSDTLHAMHTDDDWRTRAGVAKNPNAGHDTLHALHSDDIVDVRLGVARHPNTRSDTLHALHTDDNEMVRATLASNPNTNPDTVNTLRADDSWRVRQAVANSHTDPNVLHSMSTDDEPEVKWQVAINPNTHHDTLHAMHTDDDWRIRERIARSPKTRHDTLHALHTDDDHDVRSGLAHNPNTRHDTLHALSTDDEWDVKSGVASNPNTRHDTLHALSTDEGQSVRADVARHPNTRSDTLHAMRNDDDDAGVRSAAKEALKKRGLL